MQKSLLVIFWADGILYSWFIQINYGLKVIKS
jgi:hypothetical protein